jgi:predicted transcriptional regulator
MINKFLKEKKALIMMNLLDGADYIRHIAENSGCMYPHALQTLKYLEDRGYVGSSKKGRVRTYELTDEGEKIAQRIQELWDLTAEE